MWSAREGGEADGKRFLEAGGERGPARWEKNGKARLRDIMSKF